MPFLSLPSSLESQGQQSLCPYSFLGGTCLMRKLSYSRFQVSWHNTSVIHGLMVLGQCPRHSLSQRLKEWLRMNKEHLNNPHSTSSFHRKLGREAEKCNWVELCPVPSPTLQLSGHCFLLLLPGSVSHRAHPRAPTGKSSAKG